jgi:Zn-dependent protease with chaperone function
MFVIRCIGVSLAVFVLLYGMVSLLVTLGWKRLERSTSRMTPARSAALLFGIRVLPLAVAAAVTLIFTIPSFLILEPEASGEAIGEIPLVLGAACLALLITGFVRVIRAQLRTQRTVSEWLRHAKSVQGGMRVPVYCTNPGSPTLTVAGLCSPRVLVSEKAVSVLSETELQTALRHEMAHVDRYDNLKKLFFRFSVFPGMSGLESAWSDAAEMAADDAAVRNLPDALDLASALIKLSRLAPVEPCAAFTTGLLQRSRHSISARIQRLSQWTAPAQSKPRQMWYVLGPAVATAVCLAVSYSSALSAMHEVTEWLVR